ncbi:hypothetical protein [Nitrosomonas communis]|nr:hypothetical protein [Nitrosomonas communis]
MRYCRVARYEDETPRSKRSLRNRAIATLEQEVQILNEILAQAV